MLTLLVVAVAGAIGAPARLVVDQWISRRSDGPFPLGTLVINITGSLLLGLLTGLAAYHHLGKLPTAFVGAGFCGAYTTFSTFSYATVQLAQEGSLGIALGNVAASLVVGLLAAGAGLTLGWVV